MSNATCWSERYKPNRSRAGNTGTPAARTPQQCPQCAQLLIHLQFFLNIAQTRNKEKNLVKLIGVIVRTAAVWRIFGLNCLKSADAPDFVLFFQKKLVKLSEVHVLQRRFDEFCGFWKLESLRRGATVSISNAESLNFQSRVPPSRNVIKYE